MAEKNGSTSRPPGAMQHERLHRYEVGRPGTLGGEKFFYLADAVRHVKWIFANEPDAVEVRIIRLKRPA
jgi:hypothetical protein